MSLFSKPRSSSPAPMPQAADGPIDKELHELYLTTIRGFCFF
jgi:hypothetical protein